MRRFALVTAFVLSATGTHSPLALAGSPRTELLSRLATCQAGRGLLMRAQSVWGAQIEDHLKWGAASRTDAVLVRHFDAATGEESRERKVTIYLREGQSFEDTLLDLAHELIHATSGPSWDPYDPTLTASRYIHATLEGPGGEVEATISECTVAEELRAPLGMQRCRRYKNQHGRLDRTLIVKDFYRVGRWYSELKSKLGPETPNLPQLSEDAPHLYSSTGQAPYPIALFREFEEITETACKNTGRQLASESSRQFLKRRCTGRDSGA